MTNEPGLSGRFFTNTTALWVPLVTAVVHCYEYFMRTRCTPCFVETNLNLINGNARSQLTPTPTLLAALRSQHHPRLRPLSASLPVVFAAALRMHYCFMKASYDERWLALAKLVAMPNKKVAFNAQVRIMALSDSVLCRSLGYCRMGGNPWIVEEVVRGKFIGV